MEIDTGASLSLISDTTLKHLWPHKCLLPTATRFKIHWCAPTSTVWHAGSGEACQSPSSVNPSCCTRGGANPLSRDLFSKLAGGITFTQLDLRQAYHQLPLDKQSRLYVMINIHRGLLGTIACPMVCPQPLEYFSEPWRLDIKGFR